MIAQELLAEPGDRIAAILWLVVTPLVLTALAWAVTKCLRR